MMLRMLPHMRAFSVAGGEPLGQLEQALLHRLQQLLRALSLVEATSGRGWNGRAISRQGQQTGAQQTSPSREAGAFIYLRWLRASAQCSSDYACSSRFQRSRARVHVLIVVGLLHNDGACIRSRSRPEIELVAVVLAGEDVHRPIKLTSPLPPRRNSSHPLSLLLPHPLPCCLNQLLLALILLRPQVLQERFPFLRRRRCTYDCCLTQETLHG